MLLEFGALDLMCLHVHIHTCTHMHAPTHVYTNVYTRTNMHVHMHVHTYTHMCTSHRYIQTRMQARRHTDPATHLLSWAAAQGTPHAWCAHLVVNLCTLKCCLPPHRDSWDVTRIDGWHSPALKSCHMCLLRR